MDHNPAGRSAHREAARLRRPRPGPILGWAVGGLATGALAHPSLAVPGAVGGALLGGWLHVRAAGAAAGRWSAGAAGEEATERLLAPLAEQGWVLLHDRAIPGSDANLDHLVVSRAGSVAVVDSKRWGRGAAVRAVRGRLYCGPQDRDRQVRVLEWEAQHVARTLGVPVTPLMVVHGARVAGRRFRVGGVVVVAPEQLLPVLRSLPAVGHPGAASAAAIAYPPYR
ncbi:nuclease-related domain-containing protein [Streptomyces sp. NPDC092296]|uniref:nuclease-related domain-containing protein n=1 Tax=Streptomyces sp. NPDC092296 TaxID=3366012 RepID=UPI00380BCD4E